MLNRTQHKTLGSRVAPIFDHKRKELGWSEKELSTRSGVPQPTVHRILKAEGKNPQLDNVEKIATALGISLRDALAGDAHGQDINAKPENNNVSEGPGIQGRVPLVSWVRAGEFCEAMDLYAPGYADEWLDCPFKHGSNAFCLRVVGDSMFPEYREGEVILVDPSVEAMHGDDVVVRTAEGKVTFKRLQITSEGSHLLVMNKDYPNRVIQVPPDTHICGVVTGSWTDRRRK